MTSYAAFKTALVLAGEGLLNSDTVTTADLDVAADQAGVDRPSDSHDRHAVRIALDAIQSAR